MFRLSGRRDDQIVPGFRCDKAHCLHRHVGSNVALTGARLPTVDQGAMLPARPVQQQVRHGLLHKA